jgi:hypothetical protein
MNRQLVNTIALLTALVLAGEVSASPPTPERKAYFYLDNAKRWCVVGDQALFRKLISTDRAPEFDVDEGTIAYIGTRVAWIEEYVTNEDAEESVNARYRLADNGDVLFVRLILEGRGAKSVNTYEVHNGIYKEVHSSISGVVKFRRARTVADFPFSALMSKFAQKWTVREVCLN